MHAPVRLEREAPARRQAGMTTTIGAGLTVIGGAMILVLRSQATPAPTDWLVYIVGGGFSLVGLATLVLGLKMFVMARLPETIVEVDRMPIAAGSPFQVTVRQPGPLRLESLRLNVVGEQITTRVVWRNGRRKRDTDRRLVHQQNVIDTGAATIARGDTFTTRAQATVPSEVTLVDLEGDTVVVWRLEAWGRVRGSVDFGHPFVIDVRGGGSGRRRS